MHDESPEDGDGRTPDELSREQLLRRIVTTVAEAKGCHPLELRPIAEAVNLVAVESVLENPDTNLTIGFEYEGGYVRVSKDGVEYELAE